MNVEELEALLEKATQGEWKAGGGEQYGYGWVHCGTTAILHGQDRRQYADAKLIAALHNAAPELIAKARRWLMQKRRK